MQIRIKKGSYCSGNNPEYTQFLKENEGKLVTVETDHLFNNQYNAAKFRIFDANVSDVVNDARHDKGKCKWCGAMVDKNDSEPHLNDVECAIHGIEWFTPQNTYFLKYPKGTETQVFEPVKVGTYTLEKASDYLTLRNCRKWIKFKFINGEFWIYNSIGYTRKKVIDVPFEVQQKVKTILSAL